MLEEWQHEVLLKAGGQSTGLQKKCPIYIWTSEVFWAPEDLIPKKTIGVSKAFEKSIHMGDTKLANDPILSSTWSVLSMVGSAVIT